MTSSSRIAVKFNDLHDVPYGALSPLSPHPVTIRHQTYPSLNHYFQSQRFAGSPLEIELKGATSLWELDRLTRKAEEAHYQVADWDSLKPDVMLLGNYFKFKQNPDALAILQQTGSKVVVYHNADSFWGDGGDGSGKNLLGVALMATRRRLVSEDKTKKATR